MGLKINVDGLTNVYAKIEQVNIKNAIVERTMKEGGEILDPVTGEPTGESTPIVTTVVKETPMAVILGIYTDVDKANPIKRKEFPLAYSPKADDKNPINQAYAQVKPKLDIVEDNV